MKTLVTYARLAVQGPDSEIRMTQQRDSMNNYCREKDLQILGHYEDYASGSNFERSEFQKMLQDIQNKIIQPDYVVCDTIERFSRNLSELLGMVKKLETQGVQLMIVNLKMENFPEGFKIPFQEYDSYLHRKKIQDGMIHRLRKGYWCWRPPVGYANTTRNGMKLIIQNEDSKFIKLAFELKADSQLTNSEIVKRLEEEGFKISTNKMKNIFSNPFYHGAIIHPLLPEGEVEGKHEPLISKSLFDQINKKAD